MWTWSTGDADAIQISLKTANGSFSYTGTFGRPAILMQETPPGNFIRAPIPQDVWDEATNSAGGSTNTLTVSLTVAKGGVAYGPITETWTIAPARLSGTIYYNSYGTQLAQNSTAAPWAATGCSAARCSPSTSATPRPSSSAGASGDVVAIAASATRSRRCGARLSSQHGDNGDVTELGLRPRHDGQHRARDRPHDATFPGMYPDGSIALTDGRPAPAAAHRHHAHRDHGPHLGRHRPGHARVLARRHQDRLQPARRAPSSSTQTALRDELRQHDERLQRAHAHRRRHRDAGKLPATPRCRGWPAFFPDSKSVVFHHQSACRAPTATGADRSTRARARKRRSYWTSLNGPTDVTPLDQLNGKGYLPKLAAAVHA